MISNGISTDSILVNVGDDKLTSNDDVREFHKLDTEQSDKQFILLVNKGKEGWNCRSLFGVALFRRPKSRVFVLQATMRCLRSIGNAQETGTVYLSNENMAILNEELQNNFRLNIDELTSSGDKGKKRVVVRAVPPPVTIKLKKLIKHYDLKELNLDSSIDFHLRDIDETKYAVTMTTNDMERMGRDTGTKKILTDAKENTEYSALTLTAEVARYIGKSCLTVQDVIEDSVEGMDKVLAAVNKYNEILYDTIIPALFHKFYTLEERTETKDIELRLIKPPKGMKSTGDDIVADSFYVKPELLASKDDTTFAEFAGKSFHLDNYCFDSNPEMDFFKVVLKDEDVEHLYFTGMLTSDKTEFCISYIDPESNVLRSYYPDFLAQKKDGSYIIIEVKGENKIDDEVVKAKARSATELAEANAMQYLMVPSLKAGYGLHQPQSLL